MKVLFIGTTDILGGAAKVAFEIKTALETQGGYAPMFVADKRSSDPSVKVIPRQSWRKYLSLALATENFINTDWILDTPEFKEADIVHCHNLHGRYFNLHTLEKMAALKKVVWTLHDEWAITPHCAYTLEGTTMKHGLYTCPSLATQPRILWDNTKRLAEEKIAIYKQTNLTIVTPCAWLRERVKKTPLGEKDIRIIYNGINSDIFVKTDKVTARQKLNLPLDKKIVLFLATAGKNNTWKGWKYTEEIINQYKNQPEVLFLNVGNFVSHNTEENVEYRLHVDDPALLALYYSAADVLLFTSIAENFPLVILEALSCGLPIVTFDVGGVKEVVSHLENGFLCPYTDTSALLEGLKWSLNLSTEEHEVIAKQSHELVKTKFSVNLMTERYLNLYLELIKKHD